MQVLTCHSPILHKEASHLLHFNVQQLMKHHLDFKFAFADDVENFSVFKRGDILAYEDDAAIAVTQDEIRIAFPNAKVALGERVMLILTPMASVFETYAPRG